MNLKAKRLEIGQLQKSAQVLGRRNPFRRRSPLQLYQIRMMSLIRLGLFVLFPGNMGIGVRRGIGLMILILIMRIGCSSVREPIGMFKCSMHVI